MRCDTKGARLWLRLERRNAAGSITHKCEWVVRDGSRIVRTGFGPADRELAEKRLQTYLTEKYKPARHIRDPLNIPVADVITIYLDEIGSTTSRPRELVGRMKKIMAFFSGKFIGQINGKMCRDYADQRSTPSAARRELEDLRAAIRYHHREGYATNETKIVLPQKRPSRDRWLTRSEAAQLLWTAWRLKEVQTGKETKQYTSRHVARFILVGLYTGTRAGAICDASIRPIKGHAYFDLKNGVFHRRPQGASQTNKRRPPTAVSERLLAHLKRWESKGICQEFLIEWRGKRISRITKSFASVANAAGLDGVTPHTLRHTAATWGMQSGADPWTLAGMLGMTVEMLLDQYGHFHPSFGRAAAEAISKRS